jgi:hypothetical protein
MAAELFSVQLSYRLSYPNSLFVITLISQLVTLALQFNGLKFLR